eukprot:m.179350 g.179350  ORF g.179350 m.179350 type:complete len:688 (-) comp24532_c0_seq1:250-2313(-)
MRRCQWVRRRICSRSLLSPRARARRYIVGVFGAFLAGYLWLVASSDSGVPDDGASLHGFGPVVGPGLPPPVNDNNEQYQNQELLYRFTAHRAHLVAAQSRSLHSSHSIPPHQCGGHAASLCAIAVAAQKWSNRNRRELGCALGLGGLAYYKSELGWYSLNLDHDDGAVAVRRCRGCTTTSGAAHRMASCPLRMDGAACDAVRSAAADFHFLTPITRKLVSVLHDTSVTAVERGKFDGVPISTGSLCRRWALLYALRLVLLVLTVVKDSTNIPVSLAQQLPACMQLVTRAHESIVGQLDTLTPSPERFDLAETAMSDDRVQAMLEYVVTSGSAIDMEALETRSDDRSVLSMLNRQRSRVSQGPLTPASTIRLSSGHLMPLIGLGTGNQDTFVAADGGCHEWADFREVESNPVSWEQCDRTKVTEVVTRAFIDLGLRMVDTAPLYGSEAAVFRAVRTAVAAEVPRSQLFVMTKAWPPVMEGRVGNLLAEGETGVSLDDRLRVSGLNYVDVYAEHHAMDTDDPKIYGAAWERMVRAHNSGLARDLGVSGFWKDGAATMQAHLNPCDFGDIVDGFLSHSKDEVLLMQNVTLINVELIMQCQHEPVILALAAARKNVSAAQFLLRWSLEVGIPVLVGSTNLDHIRQDMDVFNFTLTRSEMQLIDQMMSYGDLNQDTTLLLDMHFSGTDGAQR